MWSCIHLDTRLDEGGGAPMQVMMTSLINARSYEVADQALLC